MLLKLSRADAARRSSSITSSSARGRLRPDLAALDDQLDVVAVAAQGQRDGRAGDAADPGDGAFDAERRDGQAVDGDDAVAEADARVGRAAARHDLGDA